LNNKEHAQREFELYRQEDAQAQAILDRAAEEKRTTTAEEDEQWDKLFNSAKAHKTRAEKLVEQAQDADDFAATMRSLVGVPDDSSGEPAGAPVGFEAQVLEGIRSYRQAIADGGKIPYTTQLDHPIDIPAVRAINDFTDSSSLYVSDFSTRLVVYARTESPWLGQATVINSTNGRPLNFGNLTADPTTYTPGEATAITESTPTLGTAIATPAGYKALSYISNEAEEDELVGLMQIVSRVQGRSIGQAFGSASTTAILAAASNGGTATGLGGGSTATFIGYEDLLTLKYGRAAPYRLVGKWVMSNGLIQKARKWTNTYGEYLWQPAIALGQPDMFDGQPVFEDPYLATPASATKSVVYGDLSAWTIKQMPLRVALSTEYRFNTDEVALRSVYRAGGALPDAAALAYIVSANT